MFKSMDVMSDSNFCDIGRRLTAATAAIALKGKGTANREPSLYMPTGYYAQTRVRRLMRDHTRCGQRVRDHEKGVYRTGLISRCSDGDRASLRYSAQEDRTA